MQNIFISYVVRLQEKCMGICEKRGKDQAVWMAASPTLHAGLPRASPQGSRFHLSSIVSSDSTVKFCAVTYCPLILGEGCCTCLLKDWLCHVWLTVLYNVDNWAIQGVTRRLVSRSLSWEMGSKLGAGIFCMVTSCPCCAKQLDGTLVICTDRGPLDVFLCS